MTPSEFPTWAQMALAAIEAPISPPNMIVLAAVSYSEGGESADNILRNNPWNTERTGYGDTAAAGVAAAYPSIAEGVAAWAATIQNGDYPSLLLALRQGAGASAIASSDACVAELHVWQGGSNIAVECLQSAANSAWLDPVLRLYNLADLASGPAPAPPTPPTDATPHPGAWYIVKPGDNLWDIASAAYGSGPAYMRIYDANRATIGGDASLIYPGQRLWIPA